MKKLIFSNPYVEGLDLEQAARSGVGEVVLAPELADAVVAYLRSCPLVLRTTVRRADVRSGSSDLVVPSTFRTDGAWVWNGAVEYYVEHYRISPGSAFLAHLESVDFKPRKLTTAQIEAAAAFISG